MQIRDTRDRAEVERLLRWSRQQTSAGLFECVPNWDAKGPWQNDYFKDKATGLEWVIYFSDHAWPGEVKLICPKSSARPINSADA